MKNNIKNKLLMSIAALLVIAALSGCTLAAGSSTDNGQDDTAVNQKITADASESTALNSVNVSSSTDGKPDVTDKDKDTSYDESKAQKIDMSAGTGTVNITKEGTYIVTGSTSDGMIVIEVSEEEDVHLVLRDASITSKTSAAVYIISADEVYITLEGNNTLANGGTFKAIDENDIDSVIYSKDDLTVNGSGTLNITSPAGHGIVCKDDMVITGGTINIDAKEDGINTNDSLAVTDGTITVKVSDDAVHTAGFLLIEGGTFDLTAAEGLEGTYVMVNGGDITINASDDGINAAHKSDAYSPVIEINGGNIRITMDAGDTDGLDSNGDIIINGGTVDITGRSACDYDGKAEFNGGKLIVNGTEVNTIPNQMMGGGGIGGNNGEMPGNGEDFGRGGQMPDQRGNRGGQGGRSGF